MIRVAVVDDEALIREGLAALLSLMPDVDVVAEGGDGRAALHIAEEYTPDILLLDVRMPGMNGVAVTRELRARCPQVRVLLLSTFPHDEYVIEGLRAGACGYLLKRIDSERLLQALRAVMAGEAVIDPAVTGRVIAHLQEGAKDVRFHERLTPREHQVLALLAEGASNAEIAGRLHITEGTAKNHVSHILAKLGARDRAHAARLAVEWGLLRE
ncbi:MAG: DNA-binding response regulator [Anaerolineae bacterium]|nr:MAG: DNA-binding response regulator [Anaerolineae bacterium]